MLTGTNVIFAVTRLDSRDRNEEEKMPKISPKEFYALPLRVHTFLADIPLHDVWAVDLPAHSGGVSLSEFLRRAQENKSYRADAEINGFPLVARALFRFRFFL